MSLVSTEWLEKNIKHAKIIDCSWHMPNTNRNGEKEYLLSHIPNALFFDIDKNSNKNSDLPHMLPSPKDWKKTISNLGITNNDRIVIYDNSDVISSCRCWYMFLYFGHDPKLVHILDGGFEKWVKENRIESNNIFKIKKSNYLVNENYNLVKNLNEVKHNLKSNEFQIIDGRSRERFEGTAKEPREGLRSGSIPSSYCLPFKEVLNPNKTFKNISDLKNIYHKILGSNKYNNVVFSCGSGITACVLALAYYLINNNYKPVIYDGSWAEYGMIKK